MSQLSESAGRFSLTCSEEPEHADRQVSEVDERQLTVRTFGSGIEISRETKQHGGKGENPSITDSQSPALHCDFVDASQRPCATLAIGDSVWHCSTRRLRRPTRDAIWYLL